MPINAEAAAQLRSHWEGLSLEVPFCWVAAGREGVIAASEDFESVYRQAEASEGGTPDERVVFAYVLPQLTAESSYEVE
ncbi:hypothetical protein AB0K09_00520 [Streptomyces sp. NPDC049577]|uniref:hypothetical protein n=1 Tax=Streptomyces sp. NPDC049577 TaxID=3155153 RepID=UPI0034415403